MIDPLTLVRDAPDEEQHAAPEVGTASGSQLRVCATEEIPPGTSRRFDVAGHRLVIVRIGEDFYAIGDRCSHADVSLSEGSVDPDGAEIECWKHGSTFSLVTGEARCLPASRPVPVYGVSISGGSVMVTIPDDESDLL